MQNLRKGGPPSSYSLLAVSDTMTPEERCAVGVCNISLLIDLKWRANLELGNQLARLKWDDKGGDFTKDTVWTADDKTRDWVTWLKRRRFVLPEEKTPMTAHTANALIMWSVLYGCFSEENSRRARHNLPLLPLPSHISQLRPYAPMMRHVDDWKRLSLDSRLHPPFAASQPEVMEAWMSAWETIPPDKRYRKIKPTKENPDPEPKLVPPSESVSRQYLREREGLRKLREREEREMEEARQSALTVNERPASPEQQQQAADEPPPKAKRRTERPKKSEAELEAERRAYQKGQDARDYRIKLMNLQQSADSLQAFLKSTLAREGTEAYLAELRSMDLGLYSVGQDIKLLRDAVTTLQGVYRLVTEPYTPPEPLARNTPPSEEVIDV